MKLKFKLLITFLVILLICTLFFIYAMFLGTKGFYVKEYKLSNKVVTDEYTGLKIAHISDIHYGNRSVTKSDLINIVNNINSLKPDIIVLTGDLVDNDITNKQYKELVEVLSKLESSLNKYAIDGNHDYPYNKWSSLIEDCGFINLNDSYDLVYNNSNESILIAGISNNTYTDKNIKDKSEVIFDYLNSEEYNSIYSILLMHEPDFVTEIDYKKFNLVLAGHSHNGQIRVPFIGALYLPYGSKEYYKPHYKLDDTDLYISSGIGTSTLPIRLFNKPSANFYRLVKED